MNNVITSNQYASLKNQAVECIHDLNAVANSLNRVDQLVRDLNVPLAKEPNEPEVIYLRRVAAFATTREFEVLATEEQASIARELDQPAIVVSTRRKSWLGRKLNALSNLV